MLADVGHTRDVGARLWGGGGVQPALRWGLHAPRLPHTLQGQRGTVPSPQRGFGGPVQLGACPQDMCA